MRGRRLAACLWLLLGVAVWNGFFDLHVSRGARAYLQLVAEHEAGRGPLPVMAEIMDGAKRDGAIAASIWALVVVAAGWATLAWGTRGAASRRV